METISFNPETHVIIEIARYKQEIEDMKDKWYDKGFVDGIEKGFNNGYDEKTRQIKDGG